MEMSIDGLEKECQYCYREIDNSGLEGFRCTNRTAIKARDSSWCYPKNANEPCSICEYCKPREEMGMSIDEHKEHLLDIMDSMPDDTCGDWRDSLAYAITTMRKYQKITEIVTKWHNDLSFKTSMAMTEIEEVVEDGKID